VISADKTSLCGNETATLTASGCSGTIKWNTGATTATITVSSAGTYTATCSNACGESVTSNGIVINKGSLPAAPMISADKTTICSNETINLIAAGCSGTIKWNTGATGNSLTVNAVGSYSAICSNACGESGMSNIVNVVKGSSPNPPSIISNKNDVCGGEEVTLIASNCSGTITWVGLNQTGTSIKVTPFSTSTYSATCKQSACESPAATIVINVKSTGTLTISGPTAPVCKGTEITLTASGCTGTITWSNGQTGSSIKIIASESKAIGAICNGTTPVVCDFEEGTVTFKSTGGSTGSDIITKYVVTDGTGNIKQINDSPSFTNIVSGNYKAFAVTYKTGITGLTVGTNIANISATCKATTEKAFTVCNKTNGCSPSAQIQINVLEQTAPPVISANKTSICSTETAQLTATGCTGTIKWSNGSTGSSISVNTIGTYTASCSSTCGASIESNAIVITLKTDCGGGCITTPPVISASKTEICKPENITLTATGCSKNIIWSNGSTGSVITVKPLASTQYSAICTDGDKCVSGMSNTVTIKVGVISTPILTCSTDLICAGESVTLKAYNCSGIIVWSNGSTGESITVTPTQSTTYTAKCKVGDCESANAESHSITVGVPNKPFIYCSKNTICALESTTLTASGCVGVVEWSSGQTGAVITVTPLVEKTVYSAVCRSIGGKCVSEKSNEITVTVGKKVEAPKVISTIKNVCPFNSADLNSAVLSEPSTVGGTFEFHTSSSPNSPLVTNIGKVGAGKYWVFERSATGCYCDGTEITVVIETCKDGINPPPVDSVDVSITKTANSPIVVVGENVIYTVIAKNVGKKTASGIQVRDILPNGLSFVSGSANIANTNGTIIGKADTLKVGQSATFTITAKVTGTGKITNKAELFRIDQNDTVLSNNSSEYSINNPVNGELIGLAKAAGTPVNVNGNVYDVPFTFNVLNMGSTDLTNVQVTDDLDKTFGSGAKIVGDSIKVSVDSGFVANAKYSGRATQINLLDPAKSNLKKGERKTIKFTVRVDLTNATTNKFFNTAEVTTGSLKDKSTDGINPDPDGDGSPLNNDELTPVTFEIKQDTSTVKGCGIGVALSIVDSMKLDETSFEISYMALIRNYGTSKIQNIKLTDSLSKVFKDIDFKVVGTPSVKSKSTLKPNPNFNGKTDVNLTIASDSSYLNTGVTDTLLYSIIVYPDSLRGPFNSYAYVSGICDGSAVSDTSNNGTIIRRTETSPTVLRLPSSTKGMVIPEGFSPNNDGVNDNFIISIAGDTKIECIEIFNRWGHSVFKEGSDTNVLTTTGWNGVSNQGIRFGTDGVPDGTYFYSIKVVGEEQNRVGYFILAR
jgi:uncharacterized repeat protein (TIGR01451 family)/gliding motility-associated-like protein